MAAKICYLGDGCLEGAASYLAGIMLHAGLKFDHVASNQPPPSADAGPYGLYVVSDYPAGQFGQGPMAAQPGRSNKAPDWSCWADGRAFSAGWENIRSRRWPLRCPS